MKRTLASIILLLPALCYYSLAGQELPAGQESISDTIALYPATIVALHPRAGEVQALKLNYLDQLAHDGGALLTHINGIAAIRKGGSYGFDPVLRGFKYDQLNVVMNGAQTASAACPNRMDPPTSQMAPNMIQRIEVLKGPHALRYGCSFGGTINFIPIPSRFSETDRVNGRLSGSYESNGNIIRSEGMVGVRNKWSELGIFLAWSEGDDYRSGDRNRVQADFLRTSFGGNLGIKLSENQTLRLSATRNMARDVDFAALPMDLREDDTWLINLNHEVSFRSRNLALWKSSLYGSLVNHLMDNFDKPLDPRKVNAETLALTQNYGGRTEGSFVFKRARLYTGLDFRIESAEGHREREFLMGPNVGSTVSDNVWQDGQILRSGIFAEYHLRAGGIKWVVSGRMEVNASDINDPDPAYSALYPESSAFHINPGLSLGGSKKITEQFSTGLWLGRTQRSGSLTERFINYFPVGQDPYEMIGNPMLDPEVNNQADLNFRWESNQTVLQLDIFAAYMQDFISSSIDSSLNPKLPDSPGVRRYVNIDKAFKTGFEASWSQFLFAGLQHQLAVAFTYAQDLVNDAPLPEIPPLDLRYHLSGNYLANRLSPYLSFRHVMEQARISDEFGETLTPSFSIIDLGLSFRIRQTIVFTAGVENLLNANYYEHLNRSARGATAIPIHAPGRSFILSFNLDFR